MANISFLKEAAPLENLRSLADPKFCTKNHTCLTKMVYAQVPYFKPSQETIQTKTIGVMLGVAIAMISFPRLLDMGLCMSLKEKVWENFFPAAAECADWAYQDMTRSLNSITTFVKASILGLCGLTSYVAARIFFHDYSEKSRIEMLRKEYSAIAQSLSKHPEMAAQLKVNLPLIEANLQKFGRIAPEVAKQLTQELTKAVL